MPVTYIHVAHDKCEISNYKDITLIVDLKKRINYISFDVKNGGQQDINTIEIIVPFQIDLITKIETDAKTCSSHSIHGRLTSILVEFVNPLKLNNTLSLKISFEVKPLKDAESHLWLYYYKLLDTINCDNIINAPPINTEGIMFCVIIPDSIIAYDLGTNAKCHKDKGVNSPKLSQLISDLEQFLNEKRVFEGAEKIPIEKRAHEIYEWGNEQLPDIDNPLRPIKSPHTRCIHLNIKKKDGIQIPFTMIYLSNESIAVLIISTIISTIISLLIARLI